ncbi:MAG TPA: condensation domain-containing protein [Kofleriaceae bacterium]|jgi:NRPS condensation-like uncharacterized protein/aryl carrier-like protein
MSSREGGEEKSVLVELHRAAVERRRSYAKYPLECGADLGRGPATAAQEQLFLVQRTAPEHAFITRSQLEIRGPLDEDALVASLHAIVAEHDILRSCLVEHDGQIELETEPRETARLDYARISIEGRERDQAVAEIIEREVRTPFSLSQSPLWRARLLHLGPELHLLILIWHQAIMDGASKLIFIEQLRGHYAARVKAGTASVPPQRPGHRDYARWQRGLRVRGVLAAQRLFWVETLKDASLLALPLDRARPPAASSAADVTRVIIPGALVSRMTQFAEQHDVTLFMLLAAALHELLARYTGADDVVIATAVANRPLPVMRDMLGHFVNPVLLRGDLRGSPTTPELLARTRTCTLNALANADLPFDEVVNGVYQVMLSVQNPKGGAQTFGAATIQGLTVDAEVVTHTDLSFNATPSGDALILSCVYRTQLFDASTIEAMCRHLVALLEAMVAEPDTPVRALSIISADEQRALDARRAAPKIERAYVAPRTPIEIALASLVQTVLNLERVSVDDDFFRLGGSSVSALRLVTRAAAAHYRLELRDVFVHPTIARLAAHLAARAAESGEQGRPRLEATGAKRTKVTPGQYGTFRLDATSPYNEMARVRWWSWIDGPVNIRALERALATLRERHWILRARFSESEGYLWQEVMPSSERSVLERFDLTALSGAAQESAEAEFHKQLLTRQFDLANGDVIRVGLATLAPNRHRMIVCCHRIVNDNVGILVQELVALWRAFTEDETRDPASVLPPVPIQYFELADYLDRLAGSPAGAQLREFWDNQLAGAPPLELPTDFPRDGVDARRVATNGFTTFAAAKTSATIPSALLAKLDAFARTEHVTTQTTLLAGLASYLGGRSGQEDLTIFGHLSLRYLPGLERAVGLFANPLVMRISTSGAPTFRELAVRTNQVAVNAYSHAECDVLSRVPHKLFRLWFNYMVGRGGDAGKLQFPAGLVATEGVHPPWGDAKIGYDMLLITRNLGDRVTLDLGYSTDLFREETAAGLLAGYIAHLEQMMR